MQFLEECGRLAHEQSHRRQEHGGSLRLRNGQGSGVFCDPTYQSFNPSSPQIERLLTDQTSVILQAVDEKLSAHDQKIDSRFAALDQHLEERLVAQDIRILAAVDRRLEKMEEHFAKSLDDLTKTLDKFLKRLTDIEEEFIFMKEDLKRVKAVIREKLGVSLD
jgi:hypothetical protein